MVVSWWWWFFPTGLLPKALQCHPFALSGAEVSHARPGRLAVMAWGWEGVLEGRCRVLYLFVAPRKCTWILLKIERSKRTCRNVLRFSVFIFRKPGSYQMCSSG